MERKCNQPGRQFHTWSIMELESFPAPLPDGSCVYANVDNCPDPRDPHLYYAEVTREVNIGSNFLYEHLKGKFFNDLIEALLYLESVDLRDLTTND